MNQTLLFSALATTVAGATVFAYLYRRTRERFLLFFLTGALLWIARYTVGLVGIAGASGLNSALVPAFSTVRALLTFWAARALMNRSMLIVPAATMGAFVLVLPAMPLGERSGVLASLPYLSLGAAMIYAGLAFAGERRFARAERHSTAWALGALGATQALYPLQDRYSWMTLLGFGSSTGLQTLVVVGILLTFLRSRVNEARRLAEQRELALTRVLSDFVSICAHCKSIRNELGEWQPAQQYVTDHTAVSLAVRLCPDCTSGKTSA